MGDEYISREETLAALQDILNDPACPIFIAATVEQIISLLPAAEVKTLEEIGEGVNDAISVLESICENGNLERECDDYHDLHDTILGIGVPDMTKKSPVHKEPVPKAMWST